MISMMDHGEYLEDGVFSFECNGRSSAFQLKRIEFA
jgi:hypothetical protein